MDASVAAALPAAFQAVELSPLCPLGTVSQLAVAHQNKVLATTRQTEVLADPAVAHVSIGEGHRSWAEAALPGATVGPLEGSYYRGVRLNLSLPVSTGVLPVCDGGLVDWLAKLRSDRKERLFISAIGTELLLRLFSGGSATA